MFWKMVLDLAKAQYNIAAVQAIGKLNALYKATTAVEIQRVVEERPFLTRIQVEKLDENLMEYRYNSGFFYEYDAESLSELLSVATVKSQTVTYFGLTREEIVKFVSEDHPHGIDRFVPMGKSMDFTLVWDGIDLITILSRIVNII